MNNFLRAYTDRVFGLGRNPFSPPAAFAYAAGLAFMCLLVFASLYADMAERLPRLLHSPAFGDTSVVLLILLLPFLLFGVHLGKWKLYSRENPQAVLFGKPILPHANYFDLAADAIFLAAFLGSASSAVVGLFSA